MKVCAKRLGFHDGLRKPGDTFDVPDDFPINRKSWFKPVGESVDKPTDKPVVRKPAVKPDVDEAI